MTCDIYKNIDVVVDYVNDITGFDMENPDIKIDLWDKELLILRGENINTLIKMYESTKERGLEPEMWIMTKDGSGESFTKKIYLQISFGGYPLEIVFKAECVMSFPFGKDSDFGHTSEEMENYEKITEIVKETGMAW